MRRTPLTLALAFAGALSFAAIAGAQTDQTGGATSQAGAGQSGQTGSQAGSGTKTGSTTGDTGSMGSTTARNSNNANKDQKYLDEVAVGNLAEIQLSQLAVQNAQDPQVKQFAQTMVDEHTKAKDQLQQVASAAGVSLPTELDGKHQKMQSKLSGLSGQDFDREYIKLMVASHKDMEGLLKKRAGKESSTSARSGYGHKPGSSSGATGTSGSATGTSGSSTDTTGSTGTTGSTASSGGSVDAQVSSLASALLPQVQQHLQEAKDLEKQLKQGGKNDKNGGNTAK